MEWFNIITEWVTPITELFAGVAASVTVLGGLFAVGHSLVTRFLQSYGRTKVQYVDTLPRRFQHPRYEDIVYVRMQTENPVGADDSGVVGLNLRVGLQDENSILHPYKILSICPAEDGWSKEDAIHPLGHQEDGTADFSVPMPPGSHFTFDVEVQIPKEAQGTWLVVELKDVRGNVKGSVTTLPWKPFKSTIMHGETT